MRISIALATFLTLGAGAVGVGAQTIPSLLGSDSLFGVTTDVISLCPGATWNITYLGGGSGGGEKAMSGGSQHIAPMSRFILANPQPPDGPTCSPSGGQADEGIVIGLDGLSLVAASSSATSDPTCNGAAPATPDPACSNPANPVFGDSGLLYSAPGAPSKTIDYGTGTFTVQDWRDVLRILFAGMATRSTGIMTLFGNRDCNSDVRRYLATHWNAIFNSGTCGQVNGAQITCPSGLQHIFVRDDISGTTDTFLLALNLPPVVRVNPADGYAYITEAAFCNSLLAADQPPSYPPVPGVNGGAPLKVNRYTADMNDFDPIRIPCAGSNIGLPAEPTEQVCNRDSTLGLVLPIVPVTPTASLPPYQIFPTTLCTGKTVFVKPPLIVDTSVSPATYDGRGLCPNGDFGFFNGLRCIAPADLNNDPNCLAAQNTKPAATNIKLQVPTLNDPKPSAVDGRVFNLHLYRSDTSGSLVVPYLLDDEGRNMQGAFYRIHTSRTMGPTGGTNINSDPTVPCVYSNGPRQIGCLVQASPCSIGFDGHEATTVYGTVALKVKGLAPSEACTLALSYPFSHKLYLNSEYGFSSTALSGPEFALAQCFGGKTTLSNGRTIEDVVAAHGYTRLPSSYNGGLPYCENMSNAVCGGTIPVPNPNDPATLQGNGACGRNDPSLPGATNSTTCNNGILEFGEECDRFAPPYSYQQPNAWCNTNCRQLGN